MKKFFIIFLLLLFSSVCSADVALSSATRTKSVNATVGLSSAARHGGGGSEAWNNYWVFDGDGDYVYKSDYTAPASATVFPSAATGYDYTILVGYEITDTTAPTDAMVYVGINASGQRTAVFSVFDATNLQIKLYDQSNVPDLLDTPLPPSNTKAIAAFVADYDSGSNSTSIDFFADYVGSGGMAEDTGSFVGPPKYSLSYPRTGYIGSYGSSTTGNFDGRLYFIAIYQSATLTASQVSSVLSGTLDPSSLSPSFYVDFSQDVAGTYTSEVGNVVFSVRGDPTKGP